MLSMHVPPRCVYCPPLMAGGVGPSGKIPTWVSLTYAGSDPVPLGNRSSLARLNIPGVLLLG